jgi:signal transduction histidine kinase/DNA-binding response OmpR family regulator
MSKLQLQPPVLDPEKIQPGNLSHEQMVISDDWTKNWQASIAVKITAVVMWAIIPFGFTIALLLVNSIKNEVLIAINDDAEILLNSARILLTDNNSYNSARTINELERKLKKSIYCKIKFSIAGSNPVLISTDSCLQYNDEIISKTKNQNYFRSQLIHKKYYFSTIKNSKVQELTLILSHQNVEKLMLMKRTNVVAIMIVIVIVLGFVLTWVIRLLVLTPLLIMVDSTRLISHGEHDLRLTLNQNDEFGYLAKFLNEMLDQVFEQQKNLKQANMELMKEVAERNRISLQLRSSRDQLEKLVDERTMDLAVARDEALEANKAKSLFLANMSHEIRTPLNAILGYAQLLLRENCFSSKQLKSLNIIEESGNHLLSLLNDVLDISKIEAGKMELNLINFDLNELLQGLAQVFHERCSDKGLIWHDNNKLSGIVPVQSDPQKLRQILINLLGNAIKFTDKGDISLFVTKKDQDLFLFEISDTGPGIDLDKGNDFFTAFHQGASGIDKGGTGLGLAITKKHLELMDSELNLSSVYGEGCTFSFTVELKNIRSGFEIRQKRGTEVIRLASPYSVRALVVDDIELNRNLLLDMLVEIKAEVNSAVNGLEALEVIKSLTLKDKPDIVFMDIHMPIMNGFDAVRKIKDEYGDAIVCVAVTASAMEQADEKYARAGFDDYIAKPYRFEAVFECMKKHLHIDFEHRKLLQSEDDGIIEIDFKQCCITSDLRDELLEASSTYALTDLKKLLSELASCGSEEKKAARELTRLMEQYDMQGMAVLISELPTQ